MGRMLAMEISPRVIRVVEYTPGERAGGIHRAAGQGRRARGVVGKVVEQGYERDEVMTLYIPEFEIRRLVFLLVEAGLTPVRVVSVPLALAGLHPANAVDALCGFLHVEPARCVLSVSGAGKLRFSREFVLELPGRAPGGAGGADSQN